MGPNYTLVTIAADGELRIAGDRHRQEVKVKLTRLALQHLADACAEYSGARQKSAARGHATGIPVQLIAPLPPVEKAARPIKLTAAERRGEKPYPVIRLKR